MSAQKTCVILGAGASHDVGGEGAPINSTYQPPLAIDLFNIAKHGIYWDIMKPYSGAVFLGQLLAPEISSGVISVEKALRHYAEHKDDQMREHYKHIPGYLRDLIYSTSRKYTPVPGSYVRLVQKLLSEYQHDVLFLILNYDNLLESALARYDSDKYKFDNINQYMDDDRNAKVVKLHGSINWFRCMPGAGNDRWDSSVANFDIFEPLPEHEIVIRDNVPEVQGIALKDHRVYPILTAPLAGKGLNDAVCPQSHIAAAKQFLSGCAKFLIIGTSGLDEDLLELLDMAIDPMQGLLLNIVDKEEGALHAHTRFKKGVRAFKNPHGTELLTVYKHGFANYLKSQAFQDFIGTRL